MTDRKVPSAIPFDYAQLDPGFADESRACAARIRKLGIQQNDAIVAIGRELLHIKTKLGHGKFGPWLATEFDMSQATAERYMAVARRLGDKIGTVQNLSPATLYRLSTRSTPAAVRDEIVHRLEIGEPLSEADIRRQIAEAREPRQPGSEPAQQEAPFERSGRQPKTLLKLIKQEWRKLTTEQQQEFPDWARASLERSPAKQPQPLPSLEAHDDVREGETAKQPEPHSPPKAHDDVTVPTQTRECKRRRGCGYSRCSEVGHCLHGAVELPRLRDDAA
jgi:hypothetical protein